jgi:hypothetical protein
MAACGLVERRMCDQLNDALGSLSTTFNAAAPGLFGYAADDVIGKPVEVAMPLPASL